MLKSSLVKFLTVGIINTIVGALTFLLLMFLIKPENNHILLVINTISVLAAITSSYIFNNSWTFKYKKNSSVKGIVYFYLFGAFNIFLNDFFFYILIKIFSLVQIHSGDLTSFSIKLLSGLFASITTYFLLSNSLYKKADK